MAVGIQALVFMLEQQEFLTPEPSLQPEVETLGPWIGKVYALCPVQFGRVYRKQTLAFVDS